MKGITEKITVLDKGFVQLQDMMPHWSIAEAESAVVNAARVSFLHDSKGSELDEKLLRYMLRNKHTSPFEHVIFKFIVKAPVIVWWQWVRHRTWSFNFQSGRYVEFHENDFYIPEQWRKQSSSNKQGSEGLIDDPNMDFEWEMSAISDLCYKQYQTSLSSGVAKEQARLFLPGFAVYYQAIATVDAHNLISFLRLRMESHAQFEIQEYARAIWTNVFTRVMPWTTKFLMETEPAIFGETK
jgi:thymidylate synthase (FAD)